ncbi:MAG: proton-conducting membrane transporter, partial [Lachnospiraceae bacterium]|nr:proton-conducting membrane transporter [Lachnospiraceae bacterium]
MRYIALSILFPIAAGVYLLVRKEPKNRKVLLAMAGVFLLLSAFWVLLAICLGGKGMYTLFNLTDRLPILFKIDEVSILFSVLAVVIFLCAGSFSFVYMKHEQREKRFYGYYLIVMGVLTALCFAGNLITFYLFFELLTLSSFPL